MPVTTTHPQYDLSLYRWATVRDATAGEEAIKRRDLLPQSIRSELQIYNRNILLARRYLPEFDPPDNVRYAKYVERAYFLGVTGRTRDALVGMIFRKPPTYTLPPRVEALLENINGAGQSLDQFCKVVSSDVLALGRAGILTDYPASDINLDAEAQQQMNLRPSLCYYTPESIINWRQMSDYGYTKLSLVVLREERDAAEDEYGHQTEEVFRVLRLEEGVYTQALYNSKGEQLQYFVPRMAGSVPFDHIPFHFVGAQNNSPSIDESPLYDLAVVNIAHYRNTADLEEAGFIVGQPTLHVDAGDTTPEFWAQENPAGITIGSRRGIVTQGGKVELVQAEERNLLVKLKESKEEEMVKIGARLVQRGGAGETAEAARINASAEASTLDMLVGNVSEAIEAALEDVCLFLGEDPEIVEYMLNRDFWETSIDTQTAMAIIQFGDAGIIARSDQRHMIRQGRIQIADGRTNDEIDDEISTQGL